MNLLRRSKISDPTRFREVYEENSPSVFRYIYSLIGGVQPDAEDLTAETFLRAWSARHRFEGEAESAIGWLISIAKRLVIDDYRLQKVRAREMPVPRAELLPEQQLLADEQKQMALQLLNELPQEHREIIILRYLLGWQINQIAQHLGETENAVSVSLFRILQRLRQKWNQTEIQELTAVTNRAEE